MKIDPETRRKIAEAIASGTAKEGPPPVIPMPSADLHKRRVDGVELPLPPSTNNLFLTAGRRRVKTPLYREWQAEAVKSLRGLGPVRPPVVVTAEVLGAVNERRDPDNLWKPLLDAAVKAGVLPDDTFRTIRRLVMIRGDGRGGPRVLLDFLPVPEEVLL